MFPLGTVLFPSLVLPLQVFEPRYRQLLDDCLDSDDGQGEFGVVLIERGSEVGGGDVRTTVGTMAQIVEARQLADGRWAVATVGTRRVRIDRWLEDDPYPRAELTDWPDADAAADPEAVRVDPALVDPVLVEGVVAALRRVLGQRAELGEPAAPATVELSDDPVLASYQAAALAPFGPADHQRLLEVPGAADRLEQLDALLAEEAAFLDQRLAGG
jgi:Lon protease-like protein